MAEDPVLVRSVGELAAAVPHYFGVIPQDSLVVFPVGSDRLPAARVDMPTSAREVAAAVEGAAGAYAGRRGEVAVLAFTSQSDLAIAVCHGVRAHLTPNTVVAVSAVIHEDRWVRLDGVGTGTIGQGDRDLFAAEFALRGQGPPAGTEAELRAMFAPAGTLPQEGMSGCLDTAQAAALDPVLAAVERNWITLALGRGFAAGGRLDDAQAGRLIADVQHVAFRDHVWAGMNQQNAAAHAELWRDLLTRSPAGTEAPAASLAAFANWLNGHGVHARLALEGVPSGTPYPMAKLIDLALQTGMDPKLWKVPPELRVDEGSPPPRGPSPIAKTWRRDPPPSLGPSPGTGPRR